VFKNVIAYRIGHGWSPTRAQMEEGLERQRFQPCGASQEKSVGWVEPRGEAHGPLVEVVDGQLMLKLLIEVKGVPTGVVNRKVKERAAQIEAATGRKPGKKETRDLKDEIKLDLLPMAFTKQGSVTVWIDPQARLLLVDAASQAKSDEVVTCLIQSLDGLVLTLVNTKTSPAVAMAGWLSSQEAPAGFSVDRECELKASDESKAVVRYSRHPLDTDEVRQHIEAGKVPTKLALTWNDRVSFLLTEGLQIKKVDFLDVVFEGARAGSKDDGFDTDVSIATAEMRGLVTQLVEALDGELQAG
jgi:recombination associated protein RdgC